MNGDTKIKGEEVGDTLGELRERFAQWRQQKSHRRQRIPGSLWEAAAGLARQQGIYPVARALGLDYVMLKARAGVAAASQAGPAKVSFVECLLPGPGIGSESVIELVNRQGARMILRLPGSGRQDWLEMAQLFLRKAS